MDDRWNVWVWDGVSWRVLGTYSDHASAMRVAMDANKDKRLTAFVVLYDHKRNDYIRAHCGERYAPWKKVK